MRTFLISFDSVLAAIDSAPEPHIRRQPAMDWMALEYFDA